MSKIKHFTSLYLATCRPAYNHMICYLPLVLFFFFIKLVKINQLDFILLTTALNILRHLRPSVNSPFKWKQKVNCSPKHDQTDHEEIVCCSLLLKNTTQIIKVHWNLKAVPGIGTCKLHNISQCDHSTYWMACSQHY